MPAGFQSWNTSNDSFQVDGNYKNLSLLRKYTVVTTLDTFFGKGSAYFSVNNSEVVAIRCERHCAIIERTASGVTVNTDRDAGGDSVTCYVFGYPTLMSNYGLQVFRPGAGSLADRIVYDAAQKPLSVVSLVSGGYPNPASAAFPAGRTYAAIVWQTFSVFARMQTDLDRGEQITQMGAVSIIGNNVNVALKQVGYSRSLFVPTIGWGGNWNNLSTTPARHLIVDVTNY
jgi:hypothetical protein